MREERSPETGQKRNESWQKNRPGERQRQRERGRNRRIRDERE